MSYFILADDPNIPANEARKRSMEMMRGNKWRLFCLDFSFFGWILLSILTLGVLYFWIIPYIQTARAEFYQDLLAREYAARNAPRRSRANRRPSPQRARMAAKTPEPARRQTEQTDGRGRPRTRAASYIQKTKGGGRRTDDAECARAAARGRFKNTKQKGAAVRLRPDILRNYMSGMLFSLAVLLRLFRPRGRPAPRRCASC